MREIDIQTQTLYAELLEIMQVAEASRNITNLKGSFATKETKGIKYVYFRTYSPSGNLDETYIGPLNEQTESLIRDHADGKTTIAETTETLKRLSAQIQAAVKLPTSNAQIRVIRNLAESGVFKSGGVLVGSLAFQLMSLTLGVNWATDSTRTNDIDLAVGPKMAVAIPMIKADIPAGLESLEMGFFPVPRLSHKAPSTNFAIRNSQLRLDVLTPKTQESDEPVFIPRFNCAAEPMSYLSYLIETPIPAVLLDAAPVLINIPQPVRYALHKLIVSQVRDVTSQSKQRKDLYQAHQILSVLKENRPYDIPPAWADLVARGPKWKRNAEAGLVAMEKIYGKLELDLS